MLDGRIDQGHRRKLPIALCGNGLDRSVRDPALLYVEKRDATILVVFHCCWLTDEAIKAIAANCTLTRLNVSCTNLTDESIKAIATNCPSLRALSQISAGSRTDQSRPSPRSAHRSRCSTSILDSVKAVATNCLSI